MDTNLQMQWYILGFQSSSMGTSVGPNYILYSYMEPWGHGHKPATCAAEIVLVSEEAELRFHVCLGPRVTSYRMISNIHQLVKKINDSVGA